MTTTTESRVSPHGLHLPCPLASCAAKPGVMCTTANGTRLTFTHMSRRLPVVPLNIPRPPDSPARTDPLLTTRATHPADQLLELLHWINQTQGATT